MNKENFHPINTPIATLARGWQGLQDSLAQVFGFRNAGNASAAITLTGLIGLGVSSVLAPPLAPVFASASTSVATLGAIGLVENRVTATLANTDRRG